MPFLAMQRNALPPHAPGIALHVSAVHCKAGGSALQSLALKGIAWHGRAWRCIAWRRNAGQGMDLHCCIALHGRALHRMALQGSAFQGQGRALHGIA